MNIEGISLDQLRAIVAVAEAGSFSAAARRFHRAQSAVSYAVAQTETQLGVEIFDRSGYRPSLTPAGRVLLRDIRAVVARADDLTARARAVAAGVEPEITLVADIVCDPGALAGLMAAFRESFPTVAVRLRSETLGMVVERVLDERVGLGIIATMIDLPEGLARHTAAPVRMVAVAAPGHALATAAPAARAAAVEAAVQVVICDRSRRTEGRDYAVFSPRTWRVDDLGVKRALIARGIGWGSLPAWQVAEDLAAGRLVRVEVPGLPENDTLPAQLFHDAGHVPGPAMAWLIARLRHPPGD